jgi:hypothetical protein
MQQQMDDLQHALTQLQEYCPPPPATALVLATSRYGPCVSVRCMTSWGVASYVPCTMPALQALSAALQEDRRRLGTFHAFLQRNGQELDCAGQGYFSVLPHEASCGVRCARARALSCLVVCVCVC